MARAAELQIISASPVGDGSAKIVFTFRASIVGSDVPAVEAEGQGAGMYEFTTSVTWDPDTETVNVFAARRAEALRGVATAIGVTIPANRAYLLAFNSA